VNYKLYSSSLLLSSNHQKLTLEQELEVVNITKVVEEVERNSLAVIRTPCKVVSSLKSTNQI